jgi:hypothetical protein
VACGAGVLDSLKQITRDIQEVLPNKKDFPREDGDEKRQMFSDLPAGRGTGQQEGDIHIDFNTCYTEETNCLLYKCYYIDRPLPR